MTYLPGTTMIFPNTCSHGMAWSLPCASCNRPTPTGTLDLAPMHDLADAIRGLTAELARLRRLAQEGETPT